MKICKTKSLRALAAAICLTIQGSALAAPLQKEHVASSAKWVLHLDNEIFRSSKVGGYVSTKLINKKFAEAEAKSKLDLDFDFNKVTSITAYSNDFEKDTGVLLIRTTANVKKDIQNIIDKANREGKPQNITKGDAPYLLYNLKGESFVAPDVNGVMIFSKSRSQLESAREVLLKKGESLAKKNNFSKVNGPSSHYLVGMIQGLNDKTPIPPNAQILKEASGGAFFLSESEDKTVAQAMLTGKTAEGANQMMQVIQGLIALVNLNQEADERVKKLAQATIVKLEGQQVNIQMSLPSQGIIDEFAKKEGIQK